MARMSDSQLGTLVWLRSRLFLNRLRKTASVVPYVDVLVSLVGAVFGLVSLGGGVAVGFGLIAHSSPDVHFLAFLVASGVFLFAWVIGLIAELQRGEMIDLKRLLHLPVSPGPLYLVNYVASLARLSVALTFPIGIGLCVGVVLGGEPRALMLLLVSVSFAFAVTSLTYWFQGWIAGFMSNPRQRRWIVVGVATTFIVLLQAPNFFFNVMPALQNPSRIGHHHRMDAQERQALRGRFEQIAGIAELVPPLWVAAAARREATGDLSFGAGITLVLTLVGGFGLLRGYRATLRASQDEGGHAGGAHVRRSRRSGPILVERQAPFFSEMVSAVATASLRSLGRAPELGLGVVSGVVVLGLTTFVLHALRPVIPSEALRALILFGLIALSALVCSQLTNNAFGLDRDGLRTFLLAPLRRRDLVLGKNLAILPVLGTLELVSVGVGGVVLRLSPLSMLAAFAQAVGVTAASLVLGNVLSVLLPIRLSNKTLGTPMRGGTAQLTALLGTLLAPIMLGPFALGPLAAWAVLVPGNPHVPGLNAVISGALAGLALVVYTVSLGPTGALLERREEKLLLKVTSDE